VGASLTVTTAGSHDTASAVVGVPATGPDFAYISCGTWGLVGVETERPIITDAGRDANFTNEGGVDGRTRYLHNVMGLWLLSESVRDWERDGSTIELAALLRAAAEVGGPIAIFDVDDPVFQAPDDMPARIARWCREHDQPVPSTRAEFTRSIVESLAQAFANAVHTVQDLSGVDARVIHLVGGGSQNALLCQATADRSGIPVLAGPVEATAVGNVLVQARSAGIIEGDLESLRGIVANAYELLPYAPRS
jgi:rhamnulokinase